MAKASTKAPEQTGAEPKYLRQLIEKKKPVEVKLENGELITGVIEYYDQAFLRVTRENEPNVFIYKDDIKYFYETGADQEETEPPDDADEAEEDE
ncbi:MAG: RNA chaperone Hfq [Bryobacteraceae bacterium]|nr:RNA chaperone Hfq [Bryobacteraceae bacterium]